MTKKLTNAELLQELDYRLNQTKEIGFWIENQDCYLWENTLHYTNKIKVGDLSLTQENYWKKMAEEIDKLAQEHEKRGKFLASKFQAISDVELIEELKKRSKSQAIKLSMYAGNDFIHLDAEDINKGVSVPFDIEVRKKGDSDD